MWMIGLLNFEDHLTPVKWSCWEHMNNRLEALSGLKAIIQVERQHVEMEKQSVRRHLLKAALSYQGLQENSIISIQLFTLAFALHQWYQIVKWIRTKSSNVGFGSRLYTTDSVVTVYIFWPRYATVWCVVSIPMLYETESSVSFHVLKILLWRCLRYLLGLDIHWPHDRAHVAIMEVAVYHIPKCRPIGICSLLLLFQVGGWC